MKSTEQLKSLYDTELKDQLAGMEKERKIIKRYSTMIFLFGLILYIVLKNIQSQGLAFATGILGVLIILAGLVITFIKYTKYRNQFKETVVAKIIKLINPEFYYDANRHIEVYEFNESKIFMQKAERCQGDDYVYGKIDKTDFKFSELNAQHKVVKSEDGKTKTEWVSIFRGLFFHADFNKHLHGTTYVMPDKLEKVFGKYAHKLQELKGPLDLVKLENPEFEKLFAVYSTDQIEARYVLTPVMMESMVEISSKYGRSMYFSFNGERVYCAIKYSKALFEPRIRKSGVNYDDVEEMYHLFGLIETIIHEMNLNNRIWTKK